MDTVISYRRKGTPRWVNNALAWSSRWAVVQMVTFIPVIFSTWS
jgi:hypothetical protein